MSCCQLTTWVITRNCFCSSIKCNIAPCERPYHQPATGQSVNSSEAGKVLRPYATHTATLLPLARESCPHPAPKAYQTTPARPQTWEQQPVYAHPNSIPNATCIQPRTGCTRTPPCDRVPCVAFSPCSSNNNRKRVQQPSCSNRQKHTNRPPHLATFTLAAYACTPKAGQHEGGSQADFISQTCPSSSAPQSPGFGQRSIAL